MDPPPAVGLLAHSTELTRVAEAPTLCFVGARRGNGFMNELLEAVAHEVSALGMKTEVVLDSFPDLESWVYVLIPHEYFACVRDDHHPTPAQLGRTIAFCTEQPGTTWFELGLTQARSAGAAVDIQPSAARELRRRGLKVERFQLGYTDFWDTWRRDETIERPVDVLHMGAENERRLTALADYGGTLWSLETCIFVPPEEPKKDQRSDFLLGKSKWRQLRSAKTLLNIHRSEAPYFEWVRVLEAISNGCVVISEHSVDFEPLLPGEHFVTGGLPSLAFLADHLVRNEERLATMRLSAYDFVRSELPMRPAAERLAAIAEGLARSRRRPRQPRGVGSSQPRERKWLPGRFREAVWRALHDPRLDVLLNEQARLQSRSDAAFKRLVLGQIELARQLAAERAGLTREDLEATRTVAQTPSYHRSSPRISVVVPLYNHAEEVSRAVASVAASECEELELVVLDDGSTDGSKRTVLDFMREHPFLPTMFLEHPVNRGLGKTRNDLVASARGEYVFMLDADNEVYPTALARLASALDRDPGALFAYPMLEEHVSGKSETLKSYLPWEPGRLQEDNYIDATALFRRAGLLELGGYTEDHRLYGWEDYDLWLRCADRGLRGVLVPEILARYRQAAHSMLSITNLDVSEARSLLRTRHPILSQITAEDED